MFISVNQSIKLFVFPMIYLLKSERVERWPFPSVSVKALLYKGRGQEREGEGVTEREGGGNVERWAVSL